MSILKFRRVEMHPFNWWVVVKAAITQWKSGDKGVAQRRRVASILKTIDDALDPEDSAIANPYVKLPAAEIRDREKRNAEILAEDPLDGKNRQNLVENGKMTWGYRPVPNPDLSVVVDFAPEDIKLIVSAIEDFAKTDVSHELDQAFVDALDALEGAELVEVDTAAARLPNPLVRLPDLPGPIGPLGGGEDGRSG